MEKQTLPDRKDHQKLYVILVDDEPRLHENIRDILETAELVSRLESFGDPVSFLEFLKQQSALPDLVLLDVHFENSGLSGIDFGCHWDEQKLISSIVKTGRRSLLLPGWYNYPSVCYDIVLLGLLPDIMQNMSIAGPLLEEAAESHSFKIRLRALFSVSHSLLLSGHIF